ncbi:nuclear transport factor 2 family protein [Hydrogenophaga sp. BPS33]|uniref:nuclear transport factor 2 family protein n=1 Tax=Hydrogenophaga sp. BPS33 TaxID=2651974 RepID=UPI00131F57C0|nr:nuclear transport factor 2 family protein [Hydrogenophaga sp. BPS33]QHE86792.1 nuclear transport factor 2 family protein [Hydrogenophaga sp. BPS33]
MPKNDDTALRHLLVKERLHELEMAYCRGVDRRDADLLRSIFFDDAIEEHGEMYRGSAQAFVDWVFRDFMPRYELTTHYVLNEWYRVDGDKAEGETHRLSYHRERAPDGSATEAIAACRTFNRYECREGVWKIAFRAVVRDWVSARPVDDKLYQGHFGMEISGTGASDASYRLLSMFPRNERM